MLALTFTFSCSSDDGGDSSAKTVEIGNQVWMAKNLNINVNGSKCYEDKSANCDKYGRLYSWDMAKTACPSGWHLPSNAEWETLINSIGGSTAGTKLKSKSGWANNGNGTDNYGFSALPGGVGGVDGHFYGAGDYGHWWSATDGNGSSAYSKNMTYNSESVFNYNSSPKSSLFSVRCVKD